MRRAETVRFEGRRGRDHPQRRNGGAISRLSVMAIYGLSLALLLINDHWLKGVGVVSGLWTGKLSDVSGLLVAPATVLAIVSWCRPFGGTERLRRTAFWVTTALGSVFFAINSWPWASTALTKGLSLIGLSWRLWPDPNDLIALCVLPASYWLAVRLSQVVCSSGMPEGARMSAGAGVSAGRLHTKQAFLETVGLRALVVAGAVACLASGVPRPRDFSHGFLVNRLERTVQVRISRLAGSMDCEGGPLLADGVVQPRDFELATTHPLEARQVVRLHPDPGNGGRAVQQETDQQGSSPCVPVRLAVWVSDEKDAIVKNLAFGREQREFPLEWVDADLEDDQGLVQIAMADDGSMELRLGEGIREIELADEDETRQVPTDCQMSDGLYIEGSRILVVSEIEALGNRCTLYRGTVPEAIDAGDGDLESGMGGSGSGDTASSWGGAGGVGNAQEVTSFPQKTRGMLTVCADEPLPIAVGDPLLFEETGPQQRLEWPSGWVEVEISHNATPREDCPQVRDACGAVWVASTAMDDSYSYGHARTVEDAWTVIVGRKSCEGRMTTPGPFARWRGESF